MKRHKEGDVIRLAIANHFIQIIIQKVDPDSGEGTLDFVLPDAVSVLGLGSFVHFDTFHLPILSGKV